MERPDPENLRKWAELLSTGPLFAGSVAFGWYVGSTLDARFGTSPWLMTGMVIAGVVGSFWKFIRTLQGMGELSRPPKRRSQPTAQDSTKDTPDGGSSRGKTHDGTGDR